MSKQPRSISGKTAIVTGATGGVGKATAKALVAQGMKVAIADLDQTALDAAAAEIGGDVVAIALDVTDAAAYTRYIDEVERRLGPLDVLVNVAGIMPIGHFDKEPDKITERILDV